MINLDLASELRFRAARRFGKISTCAAFAGNHKLSDRARLRRNELVQEGLWLQGADFEERPKSRITLEQRNGALAAL